jgi:pyruvate dehydrogenase E2 component (dihydrolipoamide acetyltransferase)
MASPAARALAKQNGSDIGQIYRQLGRAVKQSDVEAAAISSADYETIVPSQMRRIIARRMLESTLQAPQYTVSVKMDMTAFLQLRTQLNKELAEDKLKLSLNDILVKCVCSAAKQVPYINAQYVSDQEIRLMKHINVGIAVAIPDGLVVPVILQADLLGLREIALLSTELIQVTKSRALQESQMTGGTITISNLGMYGIDHFTALVNRPESAILAVGGIVDTPIAVEGQVVIRPLMDITASFDHRLIDGGTGALFMAKLKKLVENPAMALL